MSAESERARHETARKSGAAFHREDLGLISVNGQDALEFVRRLSTAAIKAITIPGSTQTLFLKGDGRLVADPICYLIDNNSILLIVDEKVQQALLEHLESLHFTEKLSISEEKAVQVFEIIAPAESELPQLIENAMENKIASFSSRIGLSPVAHHYILLPADQAPVLSSIIWEIVSSNGAVIGDPDLYNLMRIEEGIPAWGSELSEKSIPLEVGLKPAISFSKGCFPGQEVVARIENLGHPANVLSGIRFSGSAEELAGAALVSGTEAAGTITSTVFSYEAGCHIGLALLKWKFREAGTQVTVSGLPGVPVEGAVYELPMAGKI